MCCGGYCGKCSGWQTAVLGVLVLLNAFLWPKWSGFDGWVAWFGVLVLLYGVVTAIWPTCGCYETEKPKKKK
jgi:MFS superfamily sulfate permease-like transporter